MAARTLAVPREAEAARVHWLPVVGLAAFKVVATMLFAGQYGWHRDELYYLASARHPALGYTDYPPVTPMIARLVQVVAPDSLVALRFASILAGAVVVVLAALIARELGGGRRAQVLAALLVVISPLFYASNFIFETVSFDQVVWALLLWLVARMLAGRGEPRLWLLAGLVLGVGLETKYTVSALAVALAAGLLLTPARRHLASRWPWLGAVLAVVLLLPNLWWQAGHGWDSVAYTLHHRGATDGPVAYWLQQAVLVNALLLPLMVAGIVWLWRSGTFRALAWTAILVELLFFAAGGKSYYPAPIYPLLYAAGAIWLERSVASGLLRRAWMSAAVVFSLLLVPIVLPVLPVDVMQRAKLLTIPTLQEMIGWPDLARQVAAASDSLPPSDRRGAMVLAANYGEAGALDLYGPALGVPPVVSPHLAYYWWAPPRMDPDVVIAVGYDRQDLEPLFGEVTLVRTMSNSYGVANQESHRQIFICRSPRRPLWQVWPSLKALD